VEKQAGDRSRLQVAANDAGSRQTTIVAALDYHDPGPAEFAWMLTPVGRICRDDPTSTICQDDQRDIGEFF
jgi:hypothetical protein